MNKFPIEESTLQHANPLLLNRRHWLKAATGIIATVSSLRAQSEATVALPLQLSINENSFGPSTKAIEAMQHALAASYRYPHAQAQQLIDAIAKQENVPSNHILLGVGSGEILLATGRYFGAKKGEVIAAVPGYTQLIDAMKSAGGSAVLVPVNDQWQHDLHAMAAKISDKTSCIYLCNPNNPTATVCDTAKLTAFVINAAKKVPVFIDEAYLECSDDFTARTLVGLVAAGHDVIISRTFSKIYSLAGLRIGYAVAKPQLLEPIKAMMTGNPNLLGVVAARASLLDHDYRERTRLQIKAGRDALITLLKQLGRQHTVSQTNFVFFHTGIPIDRFQELMKKEQIQVARPFPPMLDWCRITIGLPDEMKLVHQALRKIFS